MDTDETCFNFIVAKILVATIIGLYVFVFGFFFLVASFGKNLGLRRTYIKFLLKVFSLGEQRHGRVAELNRPDEASTSSSSDEESTNKLVISPEMPRAELPREREEEVKFRLEYGMHYLAAGMSAVVQDSLTSAFTPEELPTWNMLSRTKKNYVGVSIPLTLFWILGFFIRYGLLMPVRVLILAISLTTLCVCTFIVGLMPVSDRKKKTNAKVLARCFDFVGAALSLVPRFHNTEYRPNYGIAVANHTSPIDSMMLATDNTYDMVGQKSKGILGIFMSALGRSSTHIWFERTKSKDRHTCMQKMQEHASNRSLPPILIFPEGACVNNRTVLRFRKGAFEIDSVIYPIAIRFDTRFGDPFWWQSTFGQHLFYMMTSWAIVADVWYLPPMYKSPDENAQDFANRVQARIARQGGFNLLGWDSYLKLGSENMWKDKSTDWKKKQQRAFARNLSMSSDDELLTRED